MEAAGASADVAAGSRARAPQVGVVRQVETAAIKKAGSNRSAPFERQLTALYTRATLEAGELAAGSSSGPAAGEGPPSPGGGEEAAPAAEPELALQHPRWSSERLSSYLLCVVEEPAAGEGGGGGRGGGAVELGVVAVEASTGDVLYAQFRLVSWQLRLLSGFS